jgi:hypothetical protein
MVSTLSGPRGSDGYLFSVQYYLNYDIKYICLFNSLDLDLDWCSYNLSEI